MTDADIEAEGMRERRAMEESHERFIRQRQAACINHDERCRDAPCGTCPQYKRAAPYETPETVANELS